MTCTELQLIMPDGRLAPSVMTRAEVAEFLRLDVDSKDDDAIRKAVGRLGIIGFQVGKNTRYSLAAVVQWVDDKHKVQKGR